MKTSHGRVARLFSTYFLGNAAYQALAIVLIPLYTALLTPEDFGVLALITLAGAFLTSGISSPIGIGLDRFYFKPDYVSRRSVLLFNLLLLLAAKTIALSALYWALSETICQALFSSREFIPVVRLYAGVVLVTPFSDFLLLLLRLKEKARYHVVLSLGRFAVSVATILYCLLSLELGVLAPIIGNIAGLAFYVVLATPVLVRGVSPALSLSVLKEPLGYAYPQIVTAFVSLFMQSADRYLLRVFGSLSAVGIYSLGCMVSSVITVFLAEPLRNSLQPIVLKLETRPEDQRSLLRAGATYYYLLACFAALSLSMFAKELIMIIAQSEEFWPSEAIVPIVSLTFVQYGLGNFAGWGLAMARKSYHISGILVVSAVANLGLNLLLIPSWGVTGAAFAGLLSYVLWNGLKMHYAARFYDLHLDIRRFLQITALGVGIYICSRVAADTQHLVVDFAVKSVLLIGFWVVLIRSGFFTVRETEYFQMVLARVKAEGLGGTLRFIVRGEVSQTPEGRNAD